MARVGEDETDFSIRPVLALPRLDILPRMVRSPVEICFGTSPSQAAKSRPLVNTSPAPIAATIALEVVVREEFREECSRSQKSLSSRTIRNRTENEAESDQP